MHHSDAYHICPNSLYTFLSLFMKALARKIKKHVIYPFALAGKFFISSNVYLLTEGIDEAWMTIPMSQKLTWIAFVGNTVAILTILEILSLRA